MNTSFTVIEKLIILYDKNEEESHWAEIIGEIAMMSGPKFREPGKSHGH